MAINAIKNSGGSGGNELVFYPVSSVYVASNIGFWQPLFVKTIYVSGLGGSVSVVEENDSRTAISQNTEVTINRVLNGIYGEIGRSYPNAKVVVKL